jgi:hypothetical protein
MTPPTTKPTPGRMIQRSGHGKRGSNAGDNIATKNPMIPRETLQNTTSADVSLMRAL